MKNFLDILSRLLPTWYNFIINNAYYIYQENNWHLFTFKCLFINFCCSTENRLYQNDTFSLIEENEENTSQVSAIAAFTKGFACSGSGGSVHIFEKTNEKELYLKTKTIKVRSYLSSNLSCVLFIHVSC